MCGIFGISVNKKSKIERRLFQKSVKHLFLLSESRGKEAAGFAVNYGDNIKVFKAPQSASKMVKSSEYNNVIRDIINFEIKDKKGFIDKPISLIGHSRLVTDGSQGKDYNNQPVISDGIVGIHNGIVTNVNELWEIYPSLERKYEIDTEIILQLLRKFYTKGSSFYDAVNLTFDKIIGTVSIAAFFNDLDKILLATNNGSLYICTDVSKNILLFASEEYILKTFLKKLSYVNLFGSFSIEKVQPGDGYLIDTIDLSINKFSFKTNNHDSKLLDLKKNSRKKIINILLNENKYANSESGYINAMKVSADITPMMEKKFDEFTAQINDLKRCKKCILPETMPFISFDYDGICNYCNNYIKIEYLGKDALENYVDKYRDNNKSNVIVPFSGGRDSSYGIHFLKTELGMDPLAYTYDWGMVTDLARRNIARICGELGIEHILVSADIRKKRANIKKNVLAWLKKPSLGMIPLFMAGDKQFFYYVNKVKQQNGIDMDIWMGNQHEKTDFKYGFSNINRKKIKNVQHSLLISEEIKMLLYYGWNFISNPNYINSSLFDTLFAFYSYYKLPHNYLLLFNYIHWDEEEINSTLINEYGWETSPDTNSTWRIGDGTASFYNYIYYTVAGFSENDTFRSNQIREEEINREDALTKVEEENQPRWDSIKWYCDTIGIEFEDTINRINEMSRLYPL